MNRIIKSVVVGALLAFPVVWFSPAVSIAGDIVQVCHTWTTTDGQNIGISPWSPYAQPSITFKMPIDGNYSIFVTADTAGAAGTGDTISVALQVGCNYSVSGSEDNYARWKTVSVMRIAKSSATGALPMFLMFHDGVGQTAIDTNGVGLQQGNRSMDPVINTTASNEHLQWGFSPTLSTGLGRLVLYGADADSLITGAWTIVGCFNYEN